MKTLYVEHLIITVTEREYDKLSTLYSEVKSTQRAAEREDEKARENGTYSVMNVGQAAQSYYDKRNKYNQTIEKLLDAARNQQPTEKFIFL